MFLFSNPNVYVVFCKMGSSSSTLGNGDINVENASPGVTVVENKVRNEFYSGQQNQHSFQSQEGLGWVPPPMTEAVAIGVALPVALSGVLLFFYVIVGAYSLYWLVETLSCCTSSIVLWPIKRLLQSVSNLCNRLLHESIHDAMQDSTFASGSGTPYIVMCTCGLLPLLIIIIIGAAQGFSLGSGIAIAVFLVWTAMLVAMSRNKKPLKLFVLIVFAARWILLAIVLFTIYVPLVLLKNLFKNIERLLPLALVAWLAFVIRGPVISAVFDVTLDLLMTSWNIFSFGGNIGIQFSNVFLVDIYNLFIFVRAVFVQIIYVHLITPMINAYDGINNPGANLQTYTNSFDDFISIEAFGGISFTSGAPTSQAITGSPTTPTLGGRRQLGGTNSPTFAPSASFGSLLSAEQLGQFAVASTGNLASTAGVQWADDLYSAFALVVPAVALVVNLDMFIKAAQLELVLIVLGPAIYDVTGDIIQITGVLPCAAQSPICTAWQVLQITLDWAFANPVASAITFINDAVILPFALKFAANKLATLDASAAAFAAEEIVDATVFGTTVAGAAGEVAYQAAYWATYLGIVDLTLDQVLQTPTDLQLVEQVVSFIPPISPPNVQCTGSDFGSSVPCTCAGEFGSTPTALFPGLSAQCSTNGQTSTTQTWCVENTGVWYEYQSTLGGQAQVIAQSTIKSQVCPGTRRQLLAALYKNANDTKNVDNTHTTSAETLSSLNMAINNDSTIKSNAMMPLKRVKMITLNAAHTSSPTNMMNGTRTPRTTVQSTPTPSMPQTNEQKNATDASKTFCESCPIICLNDTAFEACPGSGELGYIGLCSSVELSTSRDSPSIRERRENHRRILYQGGIMGVSETDAESLIRRFLGDAVPPGKGNIVVRPRQSRPDTTTTTTRKPKPVSVDPKTDETTHKTKVEKIRVFTKAMKKESIKRTRDLLTQPKIRDAVAGVCDLGTASTDDPDTFSNYFDQLCIHSMMAAHAKIALADFHAAGGRVFKKGTTTTTTPGRGRRLQEEGDDSSSFSARATSRSRAEHRESLHGGDSTRDVVRAMNDVATRISKRAAHARSLSDVTSTAQRIHYVFGPASDEAGVRLLKPMQTSDLYTARMAVSMYGMYVKSTRRVMKFAKEFSAAQRRGFEADEALREERRRRRRLQQTFSQVSPSAPNTNFFGADPTPDGNTCDENSDENLLCAGYTPTMCVSNYAQCPYPNDGSILSELQYSMHNAQSTVSSWDLFASVTSKVQCFLNYNEFPNTNPYGLLDIVTSIEARIQGTSGTSQYVYCSPMTQGFPWLIPTFSQTFMQDLVGICDDGGCSCSAYASIYLGNPTQVLTGLFEYIPDIVGDGVVGYFWVWGQIIALFANAIIPWFVPGWIQFWLVGKNVIPPQVIYVFTNMGMKGSNEQLWFCWLFSGLGPLIIVVIMWILITRVAGSEVLWAIELVSKHFVEWVVAFLMTLLGDNLGCCTQNRARRVRVTTSLERVPDEVQQRRFQEKYPHATMVDDTNEGDEARDVEKGPSSFRES